MVRQKSSTNDHPSMLLSMNNLVLVYDVQGWYCQADELFEHILAVSEKVLGADHPSTLLSMNLLARAVWGGRRPVQVGLDKLGEVFCG
jgi:hypothetical protein